MKKLLLLSVLIFGLAANATAQLSEVNNSETAAAAETSHEYIPMVRYDRIWENLSSDDYHHYVVKYWKFDGSEDINGKTYHRIVKFRELNMRAEYDHDQDELNFEFDKDDDTYEVEGYLREADGRVYALAIGRYSGYDNTFHGQLYPSEQYDDNLYQPIEVLLYDFTLGVGEGYKAFSNITKKAQIFDLEVWAKSCVDVDGMERIWMSVPYCEIIEGIGPIDHGCLHYSAAGIPTRMYACNYFNRFYDLDGNVIFETPATLGFTPPAGLFSKVSDLNELPNCIVSDDCISFGEEGTRNTVSLFTLGGEQMHRCSGKGRITVVTSDLVKGVYVAVCESDGVAVCRRKIIVR